MSGVARDGRCLTAPRPPGEGPEEQLAQLADRVASIQGVGDVVTQHWFPADRFEPVQRVLDGRLGRRFWDSARAPLERRHGTWIVVAYSAGGWLFYDWAFKAPIAMKALVARSIVIAAPWRVHPDGSSVTLGTGRQRKIREWQDLAPEAIVEGLGGPLHAIFSTDDELVRPVNAAFPEPMVSSGSVIPLHLDGLTHRRLLVADVVLSYVANQVHEVVLAQAEAGEP